MPKQLPNTSPTQKAPDSTNPELDEQMYKQSLRADTLTMAMAVLDARLKREIENQQLLPSGRQVHIESYSVEELIVEAKKLLQFVTEDL